MGVLFFVKYLSMLEIRLIVQVGYGQSGPVVFDMYWHEAKALKAFHRRPSGEMVDAARC